MFRSLYTAATGMHAQETRMSVIANNLANQKMVTLSCEVAGA